MPLSRVENVKRRSQRLNLYTLRRTYGVPADLYKVTVGAPDFDTGKSNTSRVKYAIPEFITFDAKYSRKFDYSLTYLAANKNFAYGAIYEIGDRIGIIDGAFLPTGHVIDEHDYVIYDGRRYDFQSIHRLDGDLGFILHMRHLKDEVRYAIIDKCIFNRVTLGQTSNGTI
jgi:hypothetical protein